MGDEVKGIAGAIPAIGIGMDIANAVGGWFGGNERAKQQYNYQRKLNKQMAELQRQNWDYTNAENQRKHYGNAGLNVGLMYDSSGGGGAKFRRNQQRMVRRRQRQSQIPYEKSA